MTKKIRLRDRKRRGGADKGGAGDRSQDPQTGTGRAQEANTLGKGVTGKKKKKGGEHIPQKDEKSGGGKNGTNSAQSANDCLDQNLQA